MSIRFGSEGNLDFASMDDTDVLIDRSGDEPVLYFVCKEADYSISERSWHLTVRTRDGEKLVLKQGDSSTMRAEYPVDLPGLSIYADMRFDPHQVRNVYLRWDESRSQITDRQMMAFGQ